MHRALILFLLLLAPLAWSQEAEDREAPPSEAEEPADDAAADADDPLEDIEGLDELYPVEDDDAFIPSENVAFGQSIPFPTDI